MYQKLPEYLETLDAETQAGSAFNYQKPSALSLVYVIENAAYGLYSRVVCVKIPKERGTSK